MGLQSEWHMLVFSGYQHSKVLRILKITGSQFPNSTQLGVDCLMTDTEELIPDVKIHGFSNASGHDLITFVVNI